MSSWFPPPSKPRPVEGGIRARSKRGAIAQNWWSARFVEVLQNIVVGGRMERGRRYARAGQVVELTMSAGATTATVQGSRAQPYRVQIGIRAFDQTEWAQVSQVLADDAWYAARLLAGEMPPDIEDVFTGVGLSLFPANAGELSMDCSCPDGAVPCKHLAAVFYLLAESFDADPFAILGWRGRDRVDLLAGLSALRSGGSTTAVAPVERDPVAPLADRLDSYFQLQAEIPLRDPVRTRTDSLLDQLPLVEVTVRGTDLVDLLRTAYLAVVDEP